MPLSAIAGAEPLAALAPHPREVGLRREVEAARLEGEPGGHQLVEAEEGLHVGADDLDRVVGPDGLDHARQRLLRVAEGALVVRVVRRPHHPVDADAVDQLEARAGRP